MEKIYQILHEIHKEADYENATDFLEQGLLDSFDIMTLVEMLEDTFGIEVGGKDIVPENFSNVEAIQALVVRYGGTL